MTDFDKTPSNDTESNNGSDEDDFVKKKQRSSIDESADYENEDSDESDPRNIWRKRRKLSTNDQMSSMMHVDVEPVEQINSNANRMKSTTDYKNSDKCPQTKFSHIKPHDHQVPAMIPVQHDDLSAMSNKLVTTLIDVLCIFFFYVKFF